MIKYRLIAVLLIYDGAVVQTRHFQATNIVGSALTAVDFFNTWAVDEIIIVEISRTAEYLDSFVGIVEELSRRCFVPLTVGGKIKGTDLVRKFTLAGADKVVINSQAARDPDLITRIADRFGSQCLVVSIDSRQNPDMASGYEVMIDQGRTRTFLDTLEYALLAQKKGAGEIMVNSIERDGDKRGYDLELIRKVADSVTIPVIAMGGVREWDDLVNGIIDGHADAVAAGNIFHYFEHSTKKAKEHLVKAGLNVRPPTFFKVNIPRRPKYKPF